MNQRVLLVEDDRWWAESCQKTLQRVGYECTIATTAESGLESLDEHIPQAIILDFMLPGANALQFLHEVQSYDDSHAIPVILCTSLNGIDKHSEPLEVYGVRLILDKATVTPQQLVKAVKSVIV